MKGAVPESTVPYMGKSHTLENTAAALQYLIKSRVLVLCGF